jgi:hypothetical protein
MVEGATMNREPSDADIDIELQRIDRNRPQRQSCKDLRPPLDPGAPAPLVWACALILAATFIAVVAVEAYISGLFSF